MSKILGTINSGHKKQLDRIRSIKVESSSNIINDSEKDHAGNIALTDKQEEKYEKKIEEMQKEINRLDHLNQKKVYLEKRKLKYAKD